MNPLKQLQEYGQSVWLDYIRRTLILTGELQRVIDHDGLRGVTSNPAIFEKAITGSSDYAAALKLLKQHQLEPSDLFEELAVRDIQDAADVLWPVYEKTSKRDGYVSLEVSPYLARNTKGTLDEGRRLWKLVGRDNVMIKVPGTTEGIPAFQQLISEGVNINVTLLFSQKTYEAVAEAYIAGLEKFAAGGGDVSKVASVASFFISRIDSAIDATLTAKLKTAKPGTEEELYKGLMGKVAIANAKVTYQAYKSIFSGDRWNRLAKKNAQTQRVLWASTSTKNPTYRDVIYVEELIGADTVNTIPPATFDAFRDHGKLRNSLEENVDAAKKTMQDLEKAGISMREVTDKLVDDGVKIFSDAFDKLLDAIQRETEAPTPTKSQQFAYKVPQSMAVEIKASLEDWRVGKKARRLWGRDAALWTGKDEAKWLGWLNITDDQIAHRHHLSDFAEEVKGSGFTQVLLLGMGGSSLCPEVMKMTFGKIDGFPEMHVLDSTDPAQVKAVEGKVNLEKTLFIVSSKSGSTTEPNIFKQYFFDRAKSVVGGKASEHFVAITDPGSKMHKVAEGDRFRHIFFGDPTIGGRYSALSDFGMVPAAAMGVDTQKFLDQTAEMVHACTASVPVEENPGVLLGSVLGVLGKRGHDKITIVTSPPIWDLGAWLEQLLAESTGKQGKGLIPVDKEELGAPEVYGSDRLFVYLRTDSGFDAGQDAKIEALKAAGQPVVRIAIKDKYDLGQEFFRWEIATAVAGSILGINPFDQPDVEASKIVTRELTEAYEKTGSLPSEKPFFDGDGVKLFADEANIANLNKAAGSDKSLKGYLKAHLAQLKAGDYFGLLAYVQMNQPNEKTLQQTRHAVRDKKKVATCLGFGPRFLHSTGQAYKGGPNSGVFLQVTCDDAKDLAIPGQKYTFGVVKAAQARGDFQVLSDRRRRALRVHIGADVASGLEKLNAAVKSAL